MPFLSLAGPRCTGTITVPKLSCVHDMLNMPVQVSMAGDMATWLVAHSQMHPAFSDLPVMYDMSMGGFEDPTTRNTASRFEALILQLQVCCMMHKHTASADLVAVLSTCLH